MSIVIIANTLQFSCDVFDFVLRYAFELLCWRRLLRVPWTARRSNQSILKEINFEHSLEGLMLMLKFQYLGHLIRRSDSLERPWCWKDGEQEEKRAREDEMVGWHHQLNGHESEQTPGDGEGQGSLACCSPWGCKVGHDWATEQEQYSFKSFFLVFILYQVLF